MISFFIIFFLTPNPQMGAKDQVFKCLVLTPIYERFMISLCSPRLGVGDLDMVVFTLI